MAQKDPLVEYTGEGHKMFEELGAAIREEVVLTLFHAEIAPEDQAALAQPAAGPNGGGPDGGVQYEHQTMAGADAIAAAGAGEAVATALPKAQMVSTTAEKLGRNDPCWCGSGKKYKKCHGA